MNRKETDEWRHLTAASATFCGMTLKRAFDIAVAGLALIVLTPVLLTVAAAVWLSMGSPVLFRQRRPGRDEVPFTMLKFRTMKNDTDAQGRLLPDEQRITWLGSLLRKSSLDELPQLWNVVQGDMSLVGPRPLVMEYLGRYTEEHRRRHLVRPGISGLAQVSGRKNLKFGDRLNLDVWYVDHWSPGLDAKILFKTIGVVMSGKDAVPDISLEEVDDIGIVPKEWIQSERAHIGELKPVESQASSDQQSILDSSAAGTFHGNSHTTPGEGS